MKKTYDFVIIGAGVSGISAARYLRQMNPDASIAIFTAEEGFPYDKPPLSKEFMTGEKEENEIFLLSPSTISELQLDYYPGTFVHTLNPDTRMILLDDSSEFLFRKAFLATGSSPRKLFPDHPLSSHIHYLRTLSDARGIRNQLSSADRILIIGAGFIGLELAASFLKQGKEVHVFDVASHLWSRILPDTISSLFEMEISGKGIHLHFGEKPVELKEDKGRLLLKTEPSGWWEADMICAGIGVDLNLQLAQSAGLQVERGVVVNEYMQTSHPDIYAGGDIVQFRDPYVDTIRVVEHWGHAEYSGLVAASNMSGSPYAYDLLNYAWTDILDWHVDFVGLTEGSMETISRGHLKEGLFLLLYMKENRLMGYMAINWNKKELGILQKWIKKKMELDSVLNRLENDSIPIKEIDAGLI